MNLTLLQKKLNLQELTDIKDLHKVLLNILKKTTDFFDLHNICYFVCGGTMLGAVRHNGFIPWDDDVDILLPRDSYEKFKSIISCNRDFVDGLSSLDIGDKDNFWPFIKVIDKNFIYDNPNITDDYIEHAYIDIFPLDHYSDCNILHRWYLFTNKLFRAANTLKWLSKSTINKYNVIKKFLLKIIYNIFGGYQNICILIDKKAKIMNDKYINSKHLGDGSWPENMRDYFDINACFPIIKHKFEEHEFNIPKNYDLYLKTFYGDYMTLPPEDKRKSHFSKIYKIL